MIIYVLAHSVISSTLKQAGFFRGKWPWVAKSTGIIGKIGAEAVRIVDNYAIGC